MIKENCLWWESKTPIKINGKFYHNGYECMGEGIPIAQINGDDFDRENPRCEECMFYNPRNKMKG